MPIGVGEPLLRASTADPATTENSKETTSYGTESKRVLALSLPITASESLSFMAYLITTAQVGRMGPRELSALTLGRSIVHVSGLSLIVGIASGVSTLGGQAFGAGQYELVGVVTQRAILINLLMCGFILGAWTLLSQLMLALGQDTVIASLSVRYIIGVFPSLVFESITYCLHNYLSCQGVMTPLTLVAAVMTVCTPFSNYFFMTILHMGIDGVATSYNVVSLVGLLVMLVSVWAVGASWQAPDVRTWRGWSRSCLAGWRQYLGIALPSLAMICAAWWVFEAVILVAGQGPDAEVQLGIMGILFSTHTVVFMINEGFSSASSTRVSNLLGEGRAHLAQGSMAVCLFLTLTSDMLCAAALVTWARPWARLFSSDGRVLEGVVRGIPWMATAVLVDGCAEVLSGALNGAGRQALGFWINLICYWLVGLPLAHFLGGFNGSTGLWQALATATCLQAMLLGAVVFSLDWGAEARRAGERVAQGARSIAGRGGDAVGQAERGGADTVVEEAGGRRGGGYG